jgi:hypothetical protein
VRILRAIMPMIFISISWQEGDNYAEGYPIDKASLQWLECDGIDGARLLLSVLDIKMESVIEEP